MSPDLTQHPPRSPRVRISGLVLLPRILDKCRATIAGKNGDYTFNCPLDQRFFAFMEVDAEAFKKEVQSGKSDGEMFEWLSRFSKSKPTVTDIFVWSDLQEKRVPPDIETREFFHDIHKKIAPNRTDISTWFDLLDLDDYVSFGGKP